MGAQDSVESKQSWSLGIASSGHVLTDLTKGLVDLAFGYSRGIRGVKHGQRDPGGGTPELCMRVLC